MQRYVSRPASGEHLGMYEVAVWNEMQQQYISCGGPYFLSEEESKDLAHQLNVENEED